MLNRRRRLQLGGACIVLLSAASVWAQTPPAGRETTTSIIGQQEDTDTATDEADTDASIPESNIGNASTDTDISTSETATVVAIEADTDTSISATASTPPKEYTDTDTDTAPIITKTDVPIEEITLQDVFDLFVVTATMTPQQLKDAPSIMTVVTKEDIRQFGYTSVAEVLQQVLGFYIVDDHIIPNLGIRGIAGGFMDESSSIKVMIDGYPMSFRSTSGNWLGPELIPLTAVERIEIIRGPASALYGADAFLGVVNIITVKGEDLQLGAAQIAGSVTSYSETGQDLDVAVGTRYKWVDVLMAARMNQENRSGLKVPSSSPNPSIPMHKGDSRTATDLLHESRVAHSRVTFFIKNRHQISLTGHVSALERAGEFAPWSRLSNGLDADGRQWGTTVALYNGMIGLHVAIKPKTAITLDWKAIYSRGAPRDRNRLEVGSDVYYVQQDFGYDSIETSLEGRWLIHEDLTAVAGTEFVYDWENLPSSLKVLRLGIDDYVAGEVVEESSIRQGKAELYNIGAFGQTLWSGLKPYLNLTCGVRYDNHNLYGSQVSGRLGAVSNPLKKLYIKALYGSAFKAPSPLLLYGVPHRVGDIVGNPKLKPQTVHAVEGQMILKPLNSLSLSSGVAYNWLFEKAEFVQRGINRVAVNLSEIKSLSWESEVVANYKDWIKGSVKYEQQWTKREFHEKQGVYHAYLIGDKHVIYPEYILRTTLTGRMPGVPLRLSLQLRYVGARPSSEMNALENLKMYELPAYLKLDASISTEGLHFVGNRESTFSLVGKNLTNTQAADPGFAGIDYPLSALTVFLQLRQEL